ncbi:hypothetical protein WICPIJ_001332 [Wickerhamomyces pijperi]|uniref:Uncharacterized protein n=1 Tax=Wickerhamomyces pijperi TaxID=599730 RepID=A0A9P8TQX4_WICPI|nr:hypothetical protein WICPIJ_001332 [Wickerhamomyces pijperi]
MFISTDDDLEYRNTQQRQRSHTAIPDLFRLGQDAGAFLQVRSPRHLELPSEKQRIVDRAGVNTEQHRLVLLSSGLLQHGALLHGPLGLVHHVVRSARDSQVLDQLDGNGAEDVVPAMVEQLREVVPRRQQDQRLEQLDGLIADDQDLVNRLSTRNAFQLGVDFPRCLVQGRVVRTAHFNRSNSHNRREQDRSLPSHSVEIFMDHDIVVSAHYSLLEDLESLTCLCFADQSVVDYVNQWDAHELCADLRGFSDEARRFCHFLCVDEVLDCHFGWCCRFGVLDSLF